MNRRVATIWICMMACLCSSLPTRAEEQQAATVAVDTTAQLRDDYITASLLVVSPASEVYSLFGHLALRLFCPSQKMDYCFTFETSSDTQGLVRFLSGKAKGGFLASLTDNYLEAYRQAGRGITEYRLNMTPMEKLELWKRVDQAIVRGFCYRYDYMHTQCTSMCIALIGSALSERIEYQAEPELVAGSFRDQLLAEAKTYPWSAFFWQTLMGPEGDSAEPFEHKLSPLQLPAVWRNATVGEGGQPLIDNDGTTLVEPSGKPSECMLTPTVVFTLLLIIMVIVTLAQLLNRRSAKCAADAPWADRCGKIVDVVLIVGHTMLSLLLIWFVLSAPHEGTAWNWYLLAFNPLPLLVCLVRPKWTVPCLRVFLVVLLAVLVLTPFVPQLDLPHALLIGCIALRLAARVVINKKKST